MSLVNPCNISAAVSNTGVECSDSMKAAIGIIMVPKAWKDTLANITTAGGFTAYATAKCHAAPGLRWYPIGGQSAPFRNITESNETDVIETLEDGSAQFVRYGKYNRTFVMTDGGLCLASHLMAAFRSNNYSFIEIDITGQVAFMDNGDGTFSGFPTNLAYAPASMLATLKTVYKNQFMLSFSPETYIVKGKIFSGDTTEDIISISGLIDSFVQKDATATQSTTHIFFNVLTKCGDTDLVALYPGSGAAGDMAQITNFIVKLSVTPFTVITPSAVAVVAATSTNPAQVNLTGTFVSASSYTVALAPAATLLTNGIEGYDGFNSTPATILIP